MDAQELFTLNGKSAGIYYCGACKFVARTEEQAEACCKCRSCGALLDTPHGQCMPCQILQCQARIDSLVAKARHVPSHEWDDPVTVEGEYFSSVEGALDHFAQDGAEVPTPIYGTRPDPMTLDAGSIIDHATEEMYEDACDSFDDVAVKELQALLDGWLAKHAPPPGYVEDHSIVIDLDPEVQREALAEEP